MKTLTVIHCWSAPRSRSTALLYSFDSRTDTIGLDESLYRRWLIANIDTVRRPYTKELLAGVPHKDAKAEDHYKWPKEKMHLTSRIVECVEKLKEAGVEDGVVFSKQIAKFSVNFDFQKEAETLRPNEVVQSFPDGLEVRHKHLLLIRDPVAIVSSWDALGDAHGNSAAEQIEEVGINHLLSIYSKLKSLNRSFTVLDSDDLVALGPEIVLGAVVSSNRTQKSSRYYHC